MKHTDVIDWRVWKAAIIAKDGPPVSPGGPPVKAGDHLYVMTLLQESTLGDVAFPTPSPVALALDSAIRAAKDAAALRAGLVTQAGKPATFSKAHLPALYDYFECCMVAATFSFQALEAFSNQIIAEGLKDAFRLERRDGPVEWDAATIERRCSTEEKLATILPALYPTATPKGLQVWERFVTLKDLRDSTIHLKSENQYVRGRPDDQTLYFQLLNCDPFSFPKAAISMIRHFAPPPAATWLLGAEAQVA